MKQSSSFVWIALAAVCVLAGAAALWFWNSKPALENVGDSRAFGDPPRADGRTQPGAAAIVPKNTPVVTGFAGDLALKGNPRNGGEVEPFVVGDVLTLEAVALNAVEYRWTVNGEALKEKGQEWSSRPDRFFDLEAPGTFAFAVQVRGGDKEILSQKKDTTLTILPLKIIHFSKAITHDDDQHFVTGETINLQVDMAMTMKPDLDFYRFRYSVNDAPAKHPDDNEEWTTNDMLSYTFAAPGNYAFKVEARRATTREAEDRMELPETVVAADAVLLSFDSNPPKETGAGVGAQVYFSAFPTSRYGKSECRIGVKKINAADFTWLTDASGAVWSDPYRTWVPLEPGRYLVRCEIREVGKEAADDFREMVYTVIDGNF